MKFSVVILKPLLTLDECCFFLGADNLGIVWLLWALAIYTLCNLGSDFASINPSTLAFQEL
jgi:hypothetical protein